MKGKCQQSNEKKSVRIDFFPFDAFYQGKNEEKAEKSVYFFPKSVYNKSRKPHRNGGVPDSIAGERKDKHTADGVPA